MFRHLPCSHSSSRYIELFIFVSNKPTNNSPTETLRQNPVRDRVYTAQCRRVRRFVSSTRNAAEFTRHNAAVRAAGCEQDKCKLAASKTF